MSVRWQAIIAGVVFVLLVVAWFFLGFNPNRDRISELEEQQEQVVMEIGELRVRLERLLELRRQEPQLRAELTRMRDALPNDPRLPDFILQVQETANLAGIDFLSITPSLPSPFTPPGGAAQPTLQAISVSISTRGRYFEIEDFIVRMERMRRAVRINTFALAPGGAAEDDPDQPGGSPTMAVTFAMQMFVNAPAAGAAPVAGATPAPASPPTGSPPPGESPVPTATPGETPAPTATPEPEAA